MWSEARRKQMSEAAKKRWHERAGGGTPEWRALSDQKRNPEPPIRLRLTPLDVLATKSIEPKGWAD